MNTEQERFECQRCGQAFYENELQLQTCNFHPAKVRAGDTDMLASCHHILNLQWVC